MVTSAPASPVSVRAQGLRKGYQLGQLHSMRRTMARLRRRPIHPSDGGIEALAGVDFTVHQGEAIGIVGNNGSGKSTLLQILTGTTLPTSGELEVNGRVLALLAVGLSFHPELTGRENVTLLASSLGIPARTIRDRMDAVTEFAGIERHMDTPIKRYSSGMLSRLSFAIAVQFPADVYVFDEVLAVVDDEFQARCLEEIKKLHASGRTVFFVSHHGDQVTEVCQRVLWLDKGVVREFGPAPAVIEEYHQYHRSLEAQSAQ
jgi:lipopolysaccharide transport system ATP-binding protein